MSSDSRGVDWAMRTAERTSAAKKENEIRFERFANIILPQTCTLRSYTEFIMQRKVKRKDNAEVRERAEAPRKASARTVRERRKAEARVNPWCLRAGDRRRRWAGRCGERRLRRWRLIFVAD